MSDTPAIYFDHIGYERFLADIETLAVLVERDGWKPDFLVGIGRGGLTPGCFLSHRTGIPLLSIDHSTKVYVFAEALLLHIATSTRAGERYLFVDDINDSGKTIATLRATLRDNGGVAENVRVAVLINNVSSIASVDYAASAIDRTIDKAWFVFPWESVAPQEVLQEEAVEDPDRLGIGT
jgi:hypoxanthine phosphoribosyltransferase